MIWTIAAREVITRARSKGFLIITGILFVAVIGVAVLQSVIGGGDDAAREVTIGLEGDGAAYVEVLAVGDEFLAPVTLLTDAGTGPARLDDGDIDVLFDGEALTWSESPDDEVDRYVRSTVQQVEFSERADALGLSDADVDGLFEPVALGEVRLDGGDDEDGVRFIAAGASALATFMLLQIWGSFMMMGVIEEKSSKVVEVLLSHVRPSTLLSGKVLGLGILAVGQMLIVIAGMALGLALTSDVNVPSGVWGTVPLLLVTFLLGFGFYATAFAATGSMVSRQEDATSAQIPAMLPLLVGYFIAAASLTNPENLLVTIGSFVPFTAPVLLPFRTAMIDVPLWQIVVPLIILATSIVGMIKLAGRIYRYSLLRTGKRVPWTEAWRNRNDSGI